MAKLVKCKTCGADIAKTAKVCPHCGAKQKKHTFLGILLVIFGVILFIGGISGFDTSGQGESKRNTDAPSSVISENPAQNFEDEQKDTENKPTISLDEFNSISTGMTYSEVVEIIGSEGEVMSEIDLGTGEQFVTIMYTWKGEGLFGANANVTIQGGKVISKAQVGLR